MKCKNFEQDGNCKYGNSCNFAHGDEDLRAKGDNFEKGIMQNTNMYNPQAQMNYCQPLVDQSQYFQFMMQQQQQPTVQYPMMNMNTFSYNRTFLTQKCLSLTTMLLLLIWV